MGDAFPITRSENLATSGLLQKRWRRFVAVTSLLASATRSAGLIARRASAGWPMPRRRIEVALAGDARLTVDFFQADRVAARILLERRDKARRVRHHPDLAPARRAADQPCERRQQVRVQAGLRLIEHDQFGRARGVERGDPQQVAQRTVGKPWNASEFLE